MKIQNMNSTLPGTKTQATWKKHKSPQAAVQLTVEANWQQKTCTVTKCIIPNKNLALGGVQTYVDLKSKQLILGISETYL